MVMDARTIEEAITDFGNLAIVGPVALVVVSWLTWRRGPAAGLRFGAPVMLVFALTAGLKMVSRGIGGAFAGTPLALSTGAPSGHVGMSTVVYGGVALLLLRRGPEPAALLAAGLAALMLAGIAVTRVLLHTHTPADVLTGFAIGGAGALWAARLSPGGAGRAAELLLLAIAAALLMHVSGLRFHSASFI